MNCFIYLRVSTDDKGQNPRNQENSCRELASKLGFEVLDLFLEEKSAWQSYNRPVFDKMLSRAKKEDIKAIVVWDYDRVYRDRKKLLELVGTYKKLYGIKIFSVRQRFMEDLLKLDGTIGELVYDVMLNFFGWIAEEESRKKSERVKLAVRTRKGKTYSYKGNKWGRKACPKQTVDRVIELKRLYPKMSLRDIVEHPDCYQYDKTGNKKPLSRMTISRILRGDSDAQG